MALFTNSFYIDAVSFAVLLSAVFVVLFKICFMHWKRKGVYTRQPIVPFGNAKDMVLQRETMGLEFKHVYDDIKKNGRKFGGYYFFMRPIFVPVDLDLVKRIMTKDFEHFTDHVLHVDENSDPLSAHLFSLKGSRWKNLRVKLTPTFTSGKMKMMFQTLVGCSTELISVTDQLVHQKEPIDIKEIIGRFTTDIIGSCAFGIECNSLKNPNSEFRYYGKEFFNASIKDSLIRLLSITLPEVFAYIKVKSIRQDISDFFMNMVRQTVDYREKNRIVRKDFMHLLLQIKNNVKISENDIGDISKSDSGVDSSLSISEVAAQCFVFFLAGFETSSTTSTFCLFELARNIELQEKLRNEINSVLEKYDGELTYEAMMEMTYMDKCINETLRMYPPVPVHTRECTKKYTIPGTDVVLNKGAFVFIPVLGIQRDPDFYPNPDKFDPDRFTEENKAKRHTSTWLPFGDGPRLCIGIRFGVMQTKVGLTVLLKKYRFTLSSKTKVPLVMDPGNVILTAVDGIWLNAEKI